MPLITWTDSLSVGIASIDGQHKKLVDLINSLNDAMREGKGKDVIGKTIDELIAYTRTHFSTEERLFAQYEYPETAEHKQEHGKFVEEVGGFKAKFDQGAIALTVPLMNFLSDWLRSHIMQNDQKYAPFLRQKGVA